MDPFASKSFKRYAATMVKRNPHFLNLSESYLFPEVMRRVRHYQQNHPEVELLSLSIGDTSEPLTRSATLGLLNQAEKLGTREGYKGYGLEQGEFLLREKITEVFYPNLIDPDEIFVSDGAKCDIGRLQLLFGQTAALAVQNPTYPVYVDTSTVVGNRSISYLPCTPENGFFPDLSKLTDVDLLYLCSPNNPTGSVITKPQLQDLVSWAQSKKAFIIFDAAYSGFIQDPTLPRTIYEIPGADEVAIEVSSFSKLIGFTGVRLGWTIMPKKLRFENGHPVHKDYTRFVTTFFNGASVIAQAGGLAALSLEGLEEMRQMLAFYLENASLIRQELQRQNLTVYGGDNAPYLWVKCASKPSWDLFQTLLEKTGIIATPGIGFGSQGEGYLRFSSFGSRPHILKALERIRTAWPQDW
jgi:LL-diaminopimelate aminotransferase